MSEDTPVNIGVVWPTPLFNLDFRVAVGIIRDVVYEARRRRSHSQPR